MSWERFKEIRRKLELACKVLAEYNSTNTTNLKGDSWNTIYFYSMLPIFLHITQETFEDLSYRYIMSDEDLSLIENELNSFKYE